MNFDYYDGVLIWNGIEYFAGVCWNDCQRLLLII